MATGSFAAVLAASLERLLSTVPDDAVVLDVGGWAKPLARADWVIDLMPYETRGLYGSDGSGPERFTSATWVQQDMCDAKPFPFDDNHFDFVVCSHTLEDIRDPLAACREISRVGKAGYIEVPSRLVEQSFGVQGPWVGWGHHHWLVDIHGDRLDFTFKHHVIHGRSSDHFPTGFHADLTDEQKVQWLWWEGRFQFRERIFIGPGEIDEYLAGFVTTHMAGWNPRAASATAPSLARRLARRVKRRSSP
jgi:SAM-dependent methyltransferase